ncbi:uncharacterized protein G2W53_043841 [Senna tora]|uniref:Uncharacterized protein n=1 Tax=Senna tora TaxID=362788 RepID=A0A834SHW6_9FABA|nr:uncharacterized protein G2W53_043841 [Senna tora]
MGSYDDKFRLQTSTLEVAGEAHSSKQTGNVIPT